MKKMMFFLIIGLNFNVYANDHKQDIWFDSENKDFIISDQIKNIELIQGDKKILLNCIDNKCHFSGKTDGIKIKKYYK